MNVFAKRSMSDDEFYGALGQQFYALYSRLKGLDYKMEFVLTEEQIEKFNELFEHWQSDIADTYGVGITPSVRRMGLIAYRLAMILSVLRLDPHGQMPSVLVCQDTDFAFALDMVDILLGHTADIYEKLPTVDDDEVVEELLPLEINFLNALPEEFDRKVFLSIASELTIPVPSADRYVKNLIQHKKIIRIKRNQYEKSKI